jgi:DNA-binding NarL/FixJ family response regulator
MSVALTVDDVVEVAALPLRGRLLLIVHDTVRSGRVRQLLDVHGGVRLQHAASGLEGVRLALAEPPDLVLLDLRVPDLGGAEVMRRLNGEVAGRGLRVAVLTTERGAMDTIRAMSLGAYEFWLEPLRQSAFDAGLRRAPTGRLPDPACTL